MDFQWLFVKPISHRGLFDNNEIPENSLRAFEEAIINNCPIELDIRLSKDGKIFVFHDDSLERMANITKQFHELNSLELNKLTLLNTTYKIPTLEEVLFLVNGRVPLLIEIKNNGVLGYFERQLIKILRKYKGKFAVESFNPVTLIWFRIVAPDIRRGLLGTEIYCNFLSRIYKMATEFFLLPYLIKPHFISYNISLISTDFIARIKKSGIPVICWTIKNEDEFIKNKDFADNIIFEGSNLVESFSKLY